MQFEREINIYSDEAILKRFQANETSISVVQGKISALISESELIELENSNATMYSKLASAIMDIDSLTLSFSDLTTKYNTVSGQYSALDSKVAEYKAGVDGLSANISQISTNLSKNYSTTTQMNAAIKASVDGLSSTVSKTYATTTQLNTAKSDAISSAKSYTDSAKSSALTTAKGYADDAEAAANANTANRLKSYSTTAQMNSAIKQKADEISTSVSATYATKTSVTTAQNNAVSTAKDYTDSAKASALTTAKGYADDAEDAANTNTKNLLKSYSTTTQMNSAITQKANEISAKVSSVETTLKNNYSTTNEMNSAINAKANEITTSVSSIYARRSELNIANGKINDLEIWKNEASIKITDSSIISTVTSSSTYKNSVNSLIEQKADSIRLKADRISWESTYSSMTANGTLTCRNATIEGTIHSDNGDDEIYIRSAKMEFIRDGVDVGNIGTNVYYNNNRALKGLTFDLDYTGHFMSWGVENTASASTYSIQTYSMVWAYARTALAGGYQANTLNAGCDIDMHEYSIKNVWLSGIVAPNGYNGWTGEIPIYYKKGDSYYTSSITVSNGIITSAPRM